MTEQPRLLCPACSAELPSVFPGASIACVCGHRVEVLGGPSSHLRGYGHGHDGVMRSSRLPRLPGEHSPPSVRDAGPYRSAVPAHAPLPSASCPFCGNECPPMVRICPHCDVRLENVRCQRCFSLQAPGTFACARCGQSLELEPLLDASDAPCPRCNRPLEVWPGEDTRVHECPHCGGIFVPRDSLADILCSAEIRGTLREGPQRFMRESGGGSVDTRLRPLDEVRYVPCPLCHAPMNRVNFGRLSGVIVDVCKVHGTWFDAGELTRVVAFASSGGLDRTRARELEMKCKPPLPPDPHVQYIAMDRGEARAFDRTEMWRDFLNFLFGW